MKTSLGPRMLIYPTPTLVVGSYDAAGAPNAMTAAWGGVCCSKPPCVTVSLRKATFTHGNIMARRAYTLHIADESLLVATDFVGMASGRDGDKLAAAGFTAVRSELVDAPILQEFKLVLECRLFQVVELGLHTMFVGEVLDAKADAAVLDDKGRPVMDALRPLAFTPEVRTYHGLGPALGQAFHAGKALMPAKEPAKD